MMSEHETGCGPEDAEDRRAAFTRGSSALLLAASAINLGLMIPGGFVETRDFSAYSATTLIAFNSFLTVLGLGSLVLAYTVGWRRTGCRLSFFAGLAFVVVYLSDLLVVFPVSPIPMSALLTALEWIGVGLGILLMLTAIGGMASGASTRKASKPMYISGRILFGLTILAVLVIAFATWSAIRP